MIAVALAVLASVLPFGARFETVVTTCPGMNFPDLSSSPGAGVSYDKPRVVVTCTSTELTVTSNGMISFPFVAKTPNPLRSQSFTWRVPLAPRVAPTTSSIVNVLGTLGFTTTGLPIYGPTEGPMPATEAFGDPVFNKILDACGGHTGPMAEYHHHALITVTACNLRSSGVIGYALDGIPIYGGLGCLDKKCSKKATMKSGYVRTGNPKTNSWAAYTYKKAKGVLDECNGRFQPDGTYGYHATAGFPYVIGCFRGTPTVQVGSAAAPMPPMNGGPRPPGPPPPGQLPGPPPGPPPSPPPWQGASFFCRITNTARVAV